MVALLVAKELLSRLSGCGNQCCCFSSFSRCCSREGKWWEADGGAASGCWPVELLWGATGRKKQRWCPGGEERSFFSSV
jgi:hypothetical protein